MAKLCRSPFVFLLLLATLPTFGQSGAQKEQPMAKDANPDFEVVAIKPSKPDTPGWSIPSEGHFITLRGMDVISLLSIAYGIHPKQIVDAPAWLAKDRFDIDGVPDVPGEPSFEQERMMYRKLLASRFHMVLRHETRELPIYAIVLDKSGPTLKASLPGETMNTGNRNSVGQRTMRFTAMSMANFALNMNLFLERPVIDRTSLAGSYDFTLKWTYEVSSAGDVDAAPSLFTAMKEQLGLRLDAVKGPAPVLVIEHVEHPSEN